VQHNHACLCELAQDKRQVKALPDVLVSADVRAWTNRAGITVDVERHSGAHAGIDRR
jgi:hypothetical protein